MSRFLVLIMVAAMTLLVAGYGSVVLGEGTGDGGTNGTNGTDGDEITVSGEFTFQDTEVSYEEEEVITKLFELDDSASSSWSVDGTGLMNIASFHQVGTGNQIDIFQNPGGLPHDQMNVTNLYQFGDLNAAGVSQFSVTDTEIFTNNFVSGSQVGEANVVNIVQNAPLPPE